MRFSAYLNAGKPSKQVAELFIDELLQRSSETLPEICVEIAIEFVQSNLALIDFPCNITPQQVLTATYNWPESLHAYNFPYNSMLFRPFERFLRHISDVVLEKQLSFDSNSSNASQSSESSQANSPIFYFLELLGFWHRVYDDLENQECNLISPRFEEPLARINFNLLMGLHQVRKQYRLDYQHLDNACYRLYRSAIKGIFYPECHVELVDGLLTLFSEDFDLFYNHSVDSMDFFYETFTVSNQTNTYIKLFEIFEEMLSNPLWTQGQLLILTNYLIEEKMQEVYFNFMKVRKSKRLLQRILMFLKTLQSKLPTVEFFSQAFIDAIWSLLLNKDKEISTLAADTYINIMKCKFDNTIILNQILETYFEKIDSPDKLQHYIDVLWQSFPHMYNVDVYVNVIKNRQTPQMFRAYTARFLVTVCKRMRKDYANYLQTVIDLLLLLPQVLKKLSCQITVGILMEIYAGGIFNDIQYSAPEEFLEISSTFENYALSCFLSGAYAYPVMLCIFSRLNRCLYYSRNWSKLERNAGTIFIKFREIENELNNNEKTTHIVKSYCIVLQQLSILLQTGYQLFDNLAYLLTRIRARLIDTQQIYDFVSKKNYLHDVYAIEILTFGLKNLADSAVNENEKLFVKNSVDLLSNHLFNILRNVKDPTEMVLLRIKTLYCCYIQMHSFDLINLTTNSYHILVEILILINFNTTSFWEDTADDALQYHTLRNLEYKGMMFEAFIALHNSSTIEIPSNIAWKLCIHYGLPNHKFHTHLETLLEVIAKRHLEMYKHILPVLVFNLYKIQPALNMPTIQKGLKTHSDFIVSNFKDENPSALKVHIILTVLQIVEKYIKVVSLNDGLNRLVALKHLHILVADLEWTDDKAVLDIIINQAKEIKNNLLTPDEMKELLEFTQYFRKCL